MIDPQISFRNLSAMTCLLLVVGTVTQGWSEESDKSVEEDAGVSRFKVTCEGVEVIPSRRLSYSVGFEVVETLHDAFADDVTVYASGGAKRRAQAKRGSPVYRKLGARIYAHADIVNEESSIVRLLKFLGAKGMQIEDRRHDGAFDIDTEQTYTITVTHADGLGHIRWNIEDADGNQVTFLPYKSAR